MLHDAISHSYRISHNFLIPPKPKMHIFILNLELFFLFIISTFYRFLSWSSYNIHPNFGAMILIAVIFLSLVEINKHFLSLVEIKRVKDSELCDIL